MNTTIEYPRELTQIVEYLCNPDSAIQFFRETQIADVTGIQSIHRYVRTDGRQGLVLNVTEKGASENSQVIIDIKYGQPGTDQLCEDIYGAGSLSGTRVLVHTGVVDDVDDDNPGANLNLVGNPVSKINQLLLRSILTNSAYFDSQNRS
jgi:hypothetical protein